MKNYLRYIKKKNRCINLDAMINRYFSIVITYLFIQLLLFVMFKVTRFYDAVHYLYEFHLYNLCVFVLNVIINERIIYRPKKKTDFIYLIIICSILLMVHITLCTTLFSWSSFRNSIFSLSISSDDAMKKAFEFGIFNFLFSCVVVILSFIMKRVYYSKPKNMKNYIIRLNLFKISTYLLHIVNTFTYLILYAVDEIGDSVFVIAFAIIILFFFYYLIIVKIQNDNLKKLKENRRINSTFNTVSQTYRYLNNDMIMGAPEGDGTWFKMYKNNSIIDEKTEPSIFNSGNATIVPYYLPDELKDYKTKDEKELLLYCINSEESLSLIFKNQYLTTYNYKRIYDFLTRSDLEPIVMDFSYYQKDVNDRLILANALDPKHSNIEEKDNNQFYVLPFLYQRDMNFIIPTVDKDDLELLNKIAQKFSFIQSLVLKSKDSDVKLIVDDIVNNAKMKGDVTDYFYSLLKISEYLLYLIAFNDSNGRSFSKLDNITIGKLCSMINDIKIDNTLVSDVDINNIKTSVYELRKACLNTSSFNYLKLSEVALTIANIRNYFLGHGVLMHSISPSIVNHLSELTYFFVIYYVNKYKKNNYNSKIVLSNHENKKINLFIKKDKRHFLYTAYDKNGARYIDFLTGKIVIDNNMNIVVNN